MAKNSTCIDISTFIINYHKCYLNRFNNLRLLLTDLIYNHTQISPRRLAIFMVNTEGLIISINSYKGD